MSEPTRPAPRIASIDALRGLVMLMLVPDLTGGFSLHRVAAAAPPDSAWHAAARLFTHSDWVGVTLWDMVMPVFVLLIGASIALSQQARARRGETHGQVLAHAVVRAAALTVLGMTLMVNPHDRMDLVLPYIVLFGIGLPISARLARALPLRSSAARIALELTWGALVLSLPLAWIGMHVDRLGGYYLAHIFLLIGLAYVPAFLFVRSSDTTRLLAAAAVVALYGVAFHIYKAPPDLQPRGGALAGVSAQWANGTNLGAAVDRWIFAWLPRAGTFEDEPHGYHLLQAVPLIATMLVGMVAGRSMQAATDRAQVLRRLLGASIAFAAAGLVLAATGVPLVKSIWTPSWALFSTGAALGALALLYALCDVGGRPGFARPLVVLGSNSILLYTLAAHDRWRFIAPWRPAAEPLRALEPALAPLVDALLVLVTLWALAAFLHWRRWFLRL